MEDFLENLYNGTKVRARNGSILEIMVLPKNKTIYQCVREGIFIPGMHVDYQTVMDNRQLFELVEDEIEDEFPYSPEEPIEVQKETEYTEEELSALYFELQEEEFKNYYYNNQ